MLKSVSRNTPKGQHAGYKPIRLRKKTWATLNDIENLEEQESRAASKISTKLDIEDEQDFILVSGSINNEKLRYRIQTDQQEKQSNANVETQNVNESKIDEDVQAFIDNMKDAKKLKDLFENYKPRHSNIDMDELKSSDNTKLKRYKESVYFGEVEDSKRHGKGVIIYADSRIYEGMWENNYKQGKGLEILANKNKYEGDFQNGKPHGIGTFLWNNGEVYEGEWVNGVKSGSGTWKGIKGESYIGDWKNGKANGHGIHTWSNGDVYEGQIKDFVKHGLGSEKFKNGDRYVGNYNNGKLDGYGEYYWLNGSQYKGNFKDGLRFGKGVWKKSAENDDTYDGEWLNDKKHGHGTYVWASGNCYKGQYVEDVRHGYGEMNWVDGSYYKGYWENGLQHGEGELKVPLKPLKKGQFVHNVFVEPVEEKPKVEKPQLKEAKILMSKKSMSHETLPNLLAVRKQRESDEIAEIKKMIGKVSERTKPYVLMRRISSIVLHNREKTSKRYDYSNFEDREKPKPNYMKDISSRASRSAAREIDRPAINSQNRRLVPLETIKVMNNFKTERTKSEISF